MFKLLQLHEVDTPQAFVGTGLVTREWKLKKKIILSKDLERVKAANFFLSSPAPSRFTKTMHPNLVVI